MMTGDDMTLVRDFAASGSEPAFAALVERHLGLVHSAARRQAGGDAHLAEEIAQAVFIILARKADALGPQTILPAWLYRTTRYVAADALKARRRRQVREHEAGMETTQTTEETEAAWTQLAPVLDEAMAGLGETDRAALVLRYFENQTIPQIAAALRLKESAAQKRVNRALEKLRARLMKQGVTLGATIIAGAVTANSVQAAPVALVKTISVVAATKGAAAGASTLAFVKGALKIMAWTKAKTVIATAAVVMLTAGTATVVVEKVAHANSLRQRLPDGSMLVLNKVSFSDRLAAEFAVTGKNAANDLLVKPVFYRQFRCVIRGETGIEYVEEFSPLGFKKHGDEFLNNVQTSIFPRDSKWLWFRVEKSETNNPYSPWQTVADFKVPNPARPANHPWVPSATPVTNNVGEMDFVLGGVTVETRPYTPRDIWNHVVSIPTKVFQNGILLTNWSMVRLKTEDASGNYDPVLQKHRSLDPSYVWKLEMEFEPDTNFPPESVATIDLPGRSTSITTNVLDVPVTVSCDGNWVTASIPTNQPDVAIKFIGAADAQDDHLLNPSGGGSQYRFREGYFMVERGGGLSMGQIRPTKVTLAVVPNVHTTFYVQPQLDTK